MIKLNVIIVIVLSIYLSIYLSFFPGFFLFLFKAFLDGGGGLVAKSYPNLVTQGLWPTRLLCPWDFPGKNMEWFAISFSRGSF